MNSQVEATDAIDTAFLNGVGVGVLGLGLLFIGLIGFIEFNKINRRYRD